MSMIGELEKLLAMDSFQPIVFSLIIDVNWEKQTLSLKLYKWWKNIHMVWEIAADPQSPYIQYILIGSNIMFGWTCSGDPAQISRKKRKTQIRTKHMVKTATHFFGNFRQTPPLQGYWTYLNARMPICEWCYRGTSLPWSRSPLHTSEHRSWRCQIWAIRDARIGEGRG